MKKIKKLMLILFFLLFIAYLGSCNQKKELTPSGHITYSATYSSIDVKILFNDDAKSCEKYKMTLSLNDDVVSTVEQTMNKDTYTFVDLIDGKQYNLKIELYHELNYHNLTNVNIYTKSKPEGGLFVNVLSKETTYDAKPHSLEVTGKLDMFEDLDISFTSDTGEVTKDNFTKTIPGDYTVTCLIKSSNYKDIIIRAKLVINKAKFDDSIFQDVMYDYDSKPYEPSLKYEGLEYTYYTKLGQRVNEIKNAGEYIVHYSFSGDDYYLKTNGQYNVVINKTHVTLLKGSTSLTNREARDYTLTDLDFNIPIDFTYDVFKSDLTNINDFKNINGSDVYTVLIKSKETENHYLYYHAYNIYVGEITQKTFNEADILFDFSTISQTRSGLLESVIDSENTRVVVDSSQVDAANINTEICIIYRIANLSFAINSYLVDEEKPIITTTEFERHVSVDESFDITTFFSAYDAVDGNIKITLDNLDLSNVDISKPGVYKIIVTVSDKALNTATFTYNLYVSSDYQHVSDYGTKTLNDLVTFAMPSIGNVKVLVVPVDIDDSSNVDNSNSTRVEIDDTYLANLNKVFNGTSFDTDFESVKSFYQKSSYNKLNLSFDITPKVSTTYKAKHYDTESGFYELIDELMKKLNVNFSNYDANDDSYIDAVWFVYNVNYNSNSRIFWAITAYKELNNPYKGYLLNNFSFASHNFMYSDDNYNKIYNSDTNTNLVARTYIHETGHLLGLQDCYVGAKDSVKGNSYRMFGQDMMDRNMGDFNSASKAVLGWVDPIIVNSSTNITINSSSLTGDCLLVKKDYSDTNGIYDEYIMLEFYNNEGLNNLDYNKSFNKYGVRILHVNYTLAGSYFKYDNNKGTVALETLPFMTVEYVNQNPKLDCVLFDQLGIVFGKDFYANYKLSDKTLDFTFEITALEKEYVTLRFDFS